MATLSTNPDSKASEKANTNLRKRLADSRRRLLEALALLTEQDFISEIEKGHKFIDSLATLAPAERATTAAARAAVGLDPLPGPSAATHHLELPPQIVHDLAGARYETLKTLTELASEGLQLGELREIAEREEATTSAIHKRFGDRKA